MTNYNTNKTNCICAKCGKGLYRTPSTMKETNFCSKVCFDDYRRKSDKPNCTCAYCDKHFYKRGYELSLSDIHYCSKICSSAAQKIRVDVTCKNCGNEFQKRPSRTKEGRSDFCNKECHDVFQTTSTEVPCEICGKKTNKNTRDLKRSNHHFCGKKCYGVFNSGENHFNYNHTLTDDERIKNRDYSEYQIFRKVVYERDDYTCKICSKRGGGDLVVHHLNGFHWDVGGRTNKDNAVTLCIECHKDFHSIYGNRNNDLFQFSQYQQMKELVK